MGKQRSSQRKNAAMLDSDHETDNVSESSSSTIPSDTVMGSAATSEELHLNVETLLDQSLDNLYEKRGSTREKALADIIDTFNRTLPHEFVENKFATLLHQLLNSIKRGSAKEIALAAHAIGLLALTVGCGEKAQEILEESIIPISEALKSRSEDSTISSLVEGLAVIGFVGGNEPEQTEKCMQIMWQVVHPKLGPNVVATKPSLGLITAVVSAWSFLLTTVDGKELDSESWLESVSYFSTLLEKYDRSVRIAAGEALAVIYEMGNLEKFCGTPKATRDNSGNDGVSSQDVIRIQGLRSKILNQVRDLSVEAGGKGSAKKALINQRNTFRDIVEFLEEGYAPETSIKIGGESLTTTSWSKLIQLNFLKHFLGGGFGKHMQENEFVHEVFEFRPKEKLVLDGDHVSATDKRMYMSPNSVMNKARTQFLNKQRTLSQGRKAGHFALGEE